LYEGRGIPAIRRVSLSPQDHAATQGIEKEKRSVAQKSVAQRGLQRSTTAATAGASPAKAAAFTAAGKSATTVAAIAAARDLKARVGTRAPRGSPAKGGPGIWSR